MKTGRREGEGNGAVYQANRLRRPTLCGIRALAHAVRDSDVTQGRGDTELKSGLGARFTVWRRPPLQMNDRLVQGLARRGAGTVNPERPSIRVDAISLANPRLRTTDPHLRSATSSCRTKQLGLARS